MNASHSTAGPASDAHAVAPVRKTIVVGTSAARAFQVFTEEINTWWPLASKHIGKSDPKTVVLEPFVGGRWLERGVDGSECNWARPDVGSTAASRADMGNLQRLAGRSVDPNGGRGAIHSGRHVDAGGPRTPAAPPIR
jgi:hypothetical protein